MKTKMMAAVRKRWLTLLEVLIAFTLVVFCILPLIYPHVAIHKIQEEFGRRVDDDRLFNFLFSAIMVRLYKGELSFEKISSGGPYPIESDLLREAGYEADRQISGSYSFKVTNKKENEKEGAYIVSIAITFTHGPQPQTAEMEIFVYRKLLQEALPS